jgi:nitrite reductase/ring-hydroxylating ferredoxin subunit
VGVIVPFEEWTPVIPEADLPLERAISVTAGDVELFLFRAADRIFAMQDRCTHQGGPLHRGPVNARSARPTVTCPVHGSMFWLADGRVVRGPASRPQPVYDARVSDGMIEVRLRPAAGDAPASFTGYAPTS